MGALERTRQRVGVPGDGHHRFQFHAGAQRGQRPNRISPQRHRQTGPGTIFDDGIQSKAGTDFASKANTYAVKDSFN